MAVLHYTNPAQAATSLAVVLLLLSPVPEVKLANYCYV